MMNLFKKAVIFTDIHLGAKGNSEVHNTDCIDFINWMIATAKQEGCDTCFFLGDYHNNRNTMNIKTMSYAIHGLELLSQNFSQTFFIPGNHDLFYKEQRSVHSVDWARHIPNIKIINDWFCESDVIIAPWLVGDDHKKIKKLTGDYIFGHFELPSFYMNSKVRMPDHGDVTQQDFSNYGHCFSGHFHKRQTQKNITYIGNTFPHNYADAWDDDRGCMILEWGKKPVYYAWNEAPSYKTLTLSRLLDDVENIAKPKSHLKVTIDLPLSFEEASYIKETFITQYNIRELVLVPEKKEFDEDSQLELENFESVDTIISSEIINIQSDSYDPNILLAIYNHL